MKDDRTYFSRRAEQERKRASSSPDSATASLHQKFALEYERRAVSAIQLEA